MMRSTIYIACPKCGQMALMQEMQGRYLCAVCMFDYTALKNDPGKLESVLLETLKQKNFGPTFASALYQRVMLVPSQQSAEHILELAKKNNIDIFQGHGFMVKAVERLIRLFRR